MQEWKQQLNQEYLLGQRLDFTPENVESNGLEYDDMELLADLPECYLVLYTANDTPAQVRFLNILFKDDRDMETVELN